MATLIMIDQPPYGTWDGRDAMDMAFSLAAFDQPVSLLFCAAGVNWLRKGQIAEHIGQKTLEKNLAAAPIFGVDALFAERSACGTYGLHPKDMLEGVQVIDMSSEFLDGFTHTLFSG